MRSFLSYVGAAAFLTACLYVYWVSYSICLWAYKPVNFRKRRGS